MRALCIRVAFWGPEKGPSFGELPILLRKLAIRTSDTTGYHNCNSYGVYSKGCYGVSVVYYGLLQGLYPKGCQMNSVRFFRNLGFYKGSQTLDVCWQDSKVLLALWLCCIFVLVLQSSRKQSQCVLLRPFCFYSSYSVRQC